MLNPTAARNAIGPLLEELIKQLNAEGRATQQRYFRRIQLSLNSAQDDLELKQPIQELHSTPSVGFDFSSDADVLIHRILEKASELSELIESDRPVRH